MKRIFLISVGAILALIVVLYAAFLVWGGQRWTKMPLTPGEPSTAAGNYAVQIEDGGRQRRYFVHVPPGITTVALPLVIVLHGSGATGDVMDYLTGFNAIADRERFLVAYPDATAGGWNDGRQGYKDVDDVHFLRLMIDDIGARLPLDRARVYATGISNGAVMSNRLACESADKVTAVALVAGTAPPGFEAGCEPGRAVPILMFLNTKDPFVPFEGGGIKILSPFGKKYPVVAADEFVRFWVTNNDCKDSRPAELLPDATSKDNSMVTLTRHVGCNDGADVAFYRIDGAGHTWPGGEQYSTPWFVGTTNRDIDASDLIWRFFAQHALTGGS